MNLRNILTPCFCHDGRIVQDLPKESGFDRVKRMYQLNEYGLMSPEMYYLIKCASTSVMVSAFIGGVVHIFQAKEDYFRRNVASTFESQHLARRSLTDTLTLSACKGGFKYAVKYGSFSSLYLLSTMTVANYNNKITIWEHIGTGAAMGGLFRLNFGLKGMLAGASVGGVLGTFTGGIFVLALWLSNLTLDDLRSLQAETYYAMRKQQYKRSQEA